VIDVSDIIIEDFLAQNAYTSYDFTCPLAKSIGMLKCIITLYDEAQKAIADSTAEKKISWGYIKTTLAPTILKVKEGKFFDPKASKIVITEHYDKIASEIEAAFQSIVDI